MGVTVDDFEKWSMELYSTATDIDAKYHNVCIVPASLFLMNFVDEAIYMSWETSPPLRGLRQNNDVDLSLTKPISVV